MFKSGSKSAIAKIVLAAFLNGSIPILGKLAYFEGLNILTLLALRFAIASIFIIAYSKVFKSIESVSRKGMIALFSLGFIGYSLGPFAFFKALEYSPAFIVEIIFYTYPVLVLLLAVPFLKEKISKNKAIALFLALIGLLLMFSNQSSNSGVTTFGVFLALISSLSYAVFNVASQKMLRKFKSETVASYSIIASAIYYSPFLLYSNFNLTAYCMLIIVFLAIASTFLSLVLYLSGMESLGASKASIISTIEPVATLTLATLFLKEILELHQILGGFTILLSVILLSLESK